MKLLTIISKGTNQYTWQSSGNVVNDLLWDSSAQQYFEQSNEFVKFDASNQSLIPCGDEELLYLCRKTSAGCEAGRYLS